MTAVIVRFDAIALAVLVLALLTGWRRVELRTRALTLIGLLAAVSVAMALGRDGIVALAVLIVVGAGLELGRAGKAAAVLAVAAGLVGLVGPLLAVWPEAIGLGLLVVVATAMALARPPLLATPWFLLAVAAGLVGVGTGFLVRLQALDPAAVVVLVLVLQFNDGFGYAVGGRLGRTRPFPDLSPGKSVEGYLAGLAGAIVAIALLVSVDPVLRAGAWPDLLVLVVALTVAANAGDLLLSRLKRSCGIKDFGHSLPGHGGILDRFDGWLVATPALYLLCAALPVLAGRP